MNTDLSQTFAGNVEPIAKLLASIKQVRDAEVANIALITADVLEELNLKTAEDLLPLGLISTLKSIVGYSHTDLFKVTELSPEEAQKRLKFYGYLVAAQTFVISSQSGYVEKMNTISAEHNINIASDLLKTADPGYMG